MTSRNNPNKRTLKLKSKDAALIIRANGTAELYHARTPDGQGAYSNQLVLEKIMKLLEKGNEEILQTAFESCDGGTPVELKPHENLEEN